jgi:hypothetical protein
MAHRRAVARGPAWSRWLLVPVALALDGIAALGLAGHRLPLGLAVPESFLLAAPVLAYGALASWVFRARPLQVRLGAAAVLLALHAGLVALHALCFARLWSLPAPAALRLAHRWSPLIPLFQLAWVPLMAAPLAALIRRPAPSSRRGGGSPARRETLARRTSHAGRRVRPGAAGEPPTGPGGRPTAPAVGGVVGARPDPEPSLPEAAASHDPVVEEEPSPPGSVTEPEPSPFLAPPAERVGEVGAGTPAGVAPAVTGAVPTEAHPVPPAPAIEPPPLAGRSLALGAAMEPSVAAPMGAGREPEADGSSRRGATPFAGSPEVPRPAPAPLAAEPPLDPYVVARLFEPYGPLLSSDRTVRVDWTPGPAGGVVTVAPPAISRERVVRLAGCLAQALGVGGPPAQGEPVQRLALRGPEEVVVLTPLQGGVLVAATARPGALALLEVLSARAVPGPLGGPPAEAPAMAPAAVEVSISDAVRVETPAATVDVLAPAGLDAALVGGLACRLIGAIADAGGDDELEALTVDLGAHRLMVCPVRADTRPPRFVAVVGGPERPGLLGRRTERAARALREAS